MAIPAKNSGGGSDFELVPAGTYLARCVSMIHIGTIQDSYQGNDIESEKVYIMWELPTETFETDNGETKCRLIGKEYTLSMNEKANLRKHLESWRGKAFTEEESSEFDVTKLLGVPCQMNIIHKKSKAGNDYTDITAIMPVMKGTKAPAQINPSFEFGYHPFDLEAFNATPEWLRKKIVTSKEYQEVMAGEVGKPQSANETPAAEIVEDYEPPF